MRFKVRKPFAKCRMGAGSNNPISCVLFYGNKIQPIERQTVDGTAWFKFLKGNKIVWISIDDLIMY